MENRIIDTDVLIIGGGTAGCFAGITLGKKKDLDVLIVEKANIVRSGCLAAGVNAINAYITKGRVPQDYVDYRYIVLLLNCICQYRLDILTIYLNIAVSSRNIFSILVLEYYKS